MPPCQELSPLNPGSRPGAGRAMGMVVGPGPPTQRSQTRHGKLFPKAFIRLECPTDTPDRPESQRLEGTDRRWTNSRQVFKTASTGRPLQGPVCTGYPAALRLHSQSAIPHQPELGAAPLGYADSRTSSPPAPTILVVPLGWKQRRSRRTAGSPHPCVIHGSTRPATILGLPRFDGQGRWLGQAA